MPSFQLNSNIISHCDNNGMLPSPVPYCVYFYTSVLEIESVFPSCFFQYGSSVSKTSPETSQTGAMACKEVIK